MDYLGYGDRLAAQMVRDHLESLQTHKLPELAKTLGVPLDQVIEEMEIIKKLDPKPGRKYSAEEAQPVVPEVTIEKMGDDYVIRFEDDGMPHLRINKTYRQMMESKESRRRRATTSKSGSGRRSICSRTSSTAARPSTASASR